MKSVKKRINGSKIIISQVSSVDACVGNRYRRTPVSVDNNWPSQANKRDDNSL